MTTTIATTLPSSPGRYREIEVWGSPRELGQQIGEAAREEIRGFSDIALERVNKTVAVSRDAALRLAAASIEPVRGYAPHMLDELEGMADGSGLSLEKIMLLQIRNQFQADTEAGCTAFALSAAATTEGTSVVAQNWDNDPAWDPFTVVLTRRPDGKPASMTVTQAGLIAYIGFNDRGMGLCVNTLPAPSRPLGVPHYFTVRGILEADSLAGAVRAVARAERAIPANIILATPDGPADLEVTIDDVRVLRDGGTGVATHTNHCLHQDLLAVNDDFPELIDSYPRKRRIDDLLGAADGAVGIDAMKDALADHDRYPRSICRHPNDDPVHGFWVTVFSVIMEADAGRMHLSRGNPCQRPYETYGLA